MCIYFIKYVCMRITFIWSRKAQYMCAHVCWYLFFRGETTLTSSCSGAFQLAHSGEAVKLKEWLEFQFRELHQKLGAVMETQSHLQLKIDSMAERYKISCCMQQFTVNTYIWRSNSNHPLIQLKSVWLQLIQKKLQVYIVYMYMCIHVTVYLWACTCQSCVNMCAHVCTCAYLIGLQVCCGKAGAKGKFTVVSLPSEAALAEYNALLSTPPADAAKFALKRLSIIFTTEELGRSNCTKVEGQDLLDDQQILQAIKT